MSNFRINDSKPINNNKGSIRDTRLNASIVVNNDSQRNIVSFDNIDSKNAIIIKNQNLGSNLLTNENNQRNIRVTGFPQAIRNNKFNLFNYNFTQGFPLVFNYDLCNQRLTTVVNGASRFFSRHYTDNNDHEYGDVKTFISNSNGCIKSDECADLSDFISTNVDGVFLNTQGDSVIINDTIYIPKYIKFNISNSQCICADGCYLIDLTQEENARIVEHPSEFILRDSIVELVIGSENYLRIKLFSTTLAYIDIKYTLIIDTTTNKLIDYICVSKPDETGFANLIGFCQPSLRLPPTINPPLPEPPFDPPPTVVEQLTPTCSGVYILDTSTCIFPTSGSWYDINDPNLTTMVDAMNDVLLCPKIIPMSGANNYLQGYVTGTIPHPNLNNITWEAGATYNYSNQYLYMYIYFTTPVYVNNEQNIFIASSNIPLLTPNFSSPISGVANSIGGWWSGAMRSQECDFTLSLQCDNTYIGRYLFNIENCVFPPSGVGLEPANIELITLMSQVMSEEREIVFTTDSPSYTTEGSFMTTGWGTVYWNLSVGYNEGLDYVSFSMGFSSANVINGTTTILALGGTINNPDLANDMTLSTNTFAGWFTNIYNFYSCNITFNLLLSENCS